MGLFLDRQDLLDCRTAMAVRGEELTPDQLAADMESIVDDMAAGTGIPRERVVNWMRHTRFAIAVAHNAIMHALGAVPSMEIGTVCRLVARTHGERFGVNDFHVSTAIAYAVQDGALVVDGGWIRKGGIGR